LITKDFIFSGLKRLKILHKKSFNQQKQAQAKLQLKINPPIMKVFKIWTKKSSKFKLKMPN
jgi:hypothetical protein